jgi:NAD(P)-dependent dehydrogenase (short-subunit alcohol dehydrogenase family)
MTYRAFDPLITGGNSGIGLGMADALAAAGAGVSIWGTNPDKNAAAAKQLAAHGGRVQALVCDVADEAAAAHSWSRPASPRSRARRAESTTPRRRAR